MAKKKASNHPEQSFYTGNTSTAVFANGKGDRTWRSVNFQRSYQDSETQARHRDTINLGLSEINNTIRMLMLARDHIDNPPEQNTEMKPERAFQIDNISTAVFRQELEDRTVRDTVLQRDYQDNQQQWQRQQIRFYQQELSNAIHTLSQARNYLEQTEADVTAQRQAKQDSSRR